MADEINNRLLPRYVVEKLKDLKPGGKLLFTKIQTNLFLLFP